MRQRLWHQRSPPLQFCEEQRSVASMLRSREVHFSGLTRKQPQTGWPMAPIGRTPVSAVHLAATTASYSEGLHSTQPPAVDSSPASAPAPCGAGATAIAADLGFPNWAPKSAENHPSAAV